MKSIDVDPHADGRLLVRRRVPAFEATIAISQSCEIVRSRLQALPNERRLTIAFDRDDTFAIRSLRSGLRARLQPQFTGRLSANAAGGCDVDLRLAWPRIWWVFAGTLFVLLIRKSFAAATLPERVTLIVALAILIASTFLPLWWRAWRLTRYLVPHGVSASTRPR